MDAPQNTTIYRAYQFRGYTSRSGYARIRDVLDVCRRIYNRAHAERIAVYRLTGKSMSRYSQNKWLATLRRDSQVLADISAEAERGALVQLDRAYKDFFRRVKAGKKPGFPRFKPRQRYTCLDLAATYHSMVKGNRIRIKGLPTIRIQPSRPLPVGKPVGLRLIMRGRILTVDLLYAEQTMALPHTGAAVGIDMGVNARMTFDTGETVARREPDRKRERVLQRAISRKRKGSSSRRKSVEKYARHKRRERIQNRNECHRITTELVRNFGLIAIEDLQVLNMVRNGGLNKRGLNRDMHGQSWGIIRHQLKRKAAWAGRQLVAVNPAYTSRVCSKCSKINPKPKEYRLFKCSFCGHSEDRDVNAAKNILSRGRELAAGGITVEVANSRGAARNMRR